MQDQKVAGRLHAGSKRLGMSIQHHFPAVIMSVVQNVEHVFELMLACMLANVFDGFEFWNSALEIMLAYSAH
jgi:hypothetical protein